MNDEIKQVVLKTNRRYKQMHGKESRALLSLLEFWHSFEA